jgi:hypothetical protein
VDVGGAERPPRRNADGRHAVRDRLVKARHHVNGRLHRRTSTTVSDEFERWLGGDQPKALDNFIELFGLRSFALIFVLLLALPTLPLPTGGATQVLEAVVALQLVVGRRCIWLPARWQRLELGPPSRQKLLTALLRRSRWFERFSRPRAAGCSSTALQGACSEH